LQIEEYCVTLQELIERIPVVMMTTINREQQLTSRPMLAVQAEGEVLWFLTRAETDKLHDIAADDRVNVGFVGPSGEYASVSGRASVSDDRQRVERLWNPTYRAWFPEGLEDPNIVLLRISAERGAYWETSSSRAQRLVGIIKAVISGEPYEIEKQQIDFRSAKDADE
jgi:general stress protein 26